MNSEITMTRYEREAMFKILPADNDPLPPCTRNPVIIEGKSVTIFDADRHTVPVKVVSLPTVEKAA